MSWSSFSHFIANAYIPANIIDALVFGG